ncbi:MAG: hypothetical protein ACT4PE_11810 [Candidatus Eiseniibacteriota bacterium]
MNRHVIFRHYASIAILGGGLGIAAILLFARDERMPLIGSVIVAVLGFCYFAQQQKLSETTLFKDLFTEFNRRYDGLNDRLVEIDGQADSTKLEGTHRQTIVDYFNLCAEEYLFFSEGYIHPAAWRSWCAGMLWYFEREPFRALWAEESKTNSYYGLSVEAIRRGAA